MRPRFAGGGSAAVVASLTLGNSFSLPRDANDKGVKIAVHSLLLDRGARTTKFLIGVHTLPRDANSKKRIPSRLRGDTFNVAEGNIGQIGLMRPISGSHSRARDEQTGLRAGLRRVRGVDERDDALRERDVEAGGFDRGLELRLDGPVSGPVVRRGGPVTERELHGAVGEFGHEHFRRGVLQDHRLVRHDVFHSLNGDGQRIGVRDADRDVRTADRVARIVLDRRPEDHAVRRGDEESVRGLQDGGEEAHLLDGAADAAAVDVVAELVRAQDQEHDARGDVAERILHGEADGEAGGAEHGQEAGGVEPEEIKYDERADHPDERADDRVCGMREGYVALEFLEGAGDDLARRHGNELDDHEHDQRQDDGLHEADHIVAVVVPQVREEPGALFVNLADHVSGLVQMAFEEGLFLLGRRGRGFSGGGGGLDGLCGRGEQGIRDHGEYLSCVVRICVRVKSEKRISWRTCAGAPAGIPGGPGGRVCLRASRTSGGPSGRDTSSRSRRTRTTRRRSPGIRAARAGRS